jgi:Flp pilus assembly protein TadG
MNPQPRRGERGSQLVELIFVTPVLLFLFGGIVDFGFVFQRFEVVTNAAREGARLGALPGYGEADIRARVNEYLRNSGLTGTATVTVTPSVAIPPTGTRLATGVQVDVSYPHSYLLLQTFSALTGGTFPAGLTLQARSVMRYELQP